MNPLYTRIPEAHYITEARYKGAEIVSIAPDFNPSCIHADLYVPVEPGSDAALGLGMAHVIVNENLYNASFVKEQTDLALLVRTDTKEFLREADLESGGRDDQFYVLDTATKQPAKAPRPTLALGKVDPTLEGQIRVRTLDGKEVEAVPAFVLLKKHLEAYAPERAAQMCGVQADVIRDLARKVAKKRTHILVGWNSNKYYHGDLMERAQCLPYPTLTRRAQFYIDHDWFLEAGEGFPTHKPNPRMGGNHPFRMTSGHQRWSIHSIWVVNKMLSQTHQGRPTLFMNPDDAKKKGIGEGDLVRVFNDFDSFHVHVKLAPAARPGQLIIYHAWEPYQFQSWKPYDTAIPGMVKWLHLAGGYGHLRHWRWNWQPQQADRAVAVDVVRA
jgi:anaerobic selenocysteine-containing dehydrogenase